MQETESNLEVLVSPRENYNATDFSSGQTVTYASEDGGTYSVAPANLIDGTPRTINFTTARYGYTSSNYTTYSLTQRETNINSNGFLKWAGSSKTGSGSSAYLNVLSGSQSTVTATTTYSASEETELSFGGIVKYAVVLYDGINSDNSFPPNSSFIISYPDVAELMINGEIVGETVEGSDGVFTFPDARYPMTDSITSVGVRFRWTSAFSSTSSSYSNSGYRQIYLLYDESELLTEVVDIEVPNLLETIVQQLNVVISRLGSIMGFVEDDPEKQQQANQFQEDMSGAVSNMDNIKQEIEEGLDKPSPETIVPDIDIIVDTSDEYHVQYSEILADLLGNAMITNLLLIVASMMFVSYVLFGKKG